ncbi:NADH-FMN oxidoreductase RutF, flavin reductase (DIM6/NTAB) family [Thermodesulfovibrio aggregans]|uniref:NADH-FMN oxidoreductase RutF, flavin reductase (DIM6/NTAB) family n=1 Tax=Thermodesulfovibrio aggregans TaxID=86166 RepID=A0A0U9HP02_9BACT|nr:flavin reductase family protein [Thermodesulfovibrio aggregans]GAQ94792.1 NADH-FMN oxidoreductase RutF, flavin reductase (DIM6/NTAB) family [Thermodesulfovibrio aggregans]
MLALKENFYRLLHPKIVFLLTSVGKDGRDNVMSCAWSTPASEEPPKVIVCVSKEHYTAELILQTGEFAINIPTKDMVKAIWICGSKSGRNVDKFKEANLKKIKASKISAPLIEGCAGFIECKVSETVDAGECYAFLADVLTARADEKYFKKSVWIPHTIPMHLGGRKVVYFEDEKIS